MEHDCIFKPEKRDVQKHNNQVELANFRKKSAAGRKDSNRKIEAGSDSMSMSKILSHGVDEMAEKSRQSPQKSTLIQQFLFLKSFKFG